MKAMDYVALIAGGAQPVVTFQKKIVDFETYFEPGMRARVVGGWEKESGLVEIVFDTTEFDDHNRILEQPNYYDKSGNATLTAREAGQYNPKESIYFDSDDEISCFEVEDSSALLLFKEFRKADTGLTYVQWLEAVVVALRKDRVT